jgi:hypothetical protein
MRGRPAAQIDSREANLVGIQLERLRFVSHKANDRRIYTLVVITKTARGMGVWTLE